MNRAVLVQCLALPVLLLGIVAVGLSQPASSAPMPAIPRPAIPSKVFLVTDYGAVGDGKTLNTAALQKAITTCSEAGGGIVAVPTGRFLTGPLLLASSINLRLDSGATLLISDHPTDFPQANGRFQNCLSAVDCHDIAITGTGTIDGQGAFWWKNYRDNSPHRPFLVVLTRCRRVLVEGVTLTNSPMFHLVPQQCQDVTIADIHILAPSDAPNTDGLDPSGWNYLITGCTFDEGDDCIAVKASGLIAPGQPSCRNITVRNCTFLHGHGLSIGGQTPDGLENMTVENCTFEGTDAGIRMKAGRGKGGLVKNLSYDHLTMKNVKVPILITSYYPRIPQDLAAVPAEPITKTTPIWQDIRISDLTATGAKTAGQILGLPEMPVSDVTLTNVHISAKKGFQIAHARRITFSDSRVVASSGPPLIPQDAQVTGLDVTGKK